MSLKTRLALVAVALGVLLLAPLGNLWPKEMIGGSGLATGIDFVPVSRLLQERCADCHARDAGRIPWYRVLPWVRQLIDRDRESALHAWTIDRAALQGRRALIDTDRAALEGALDDLSMPPLRYRLLHWNVGMSTEDRELTHAWIRGERSRTPEAQTMAAPMRGEPVQPLLGGQHSDRAELALGERLFFDRRLSRTGTVSCATCHNLEKGGTDGLKVSTGATRQPGESNTPTVFNASRSIAQFWDGRAPDLKAAAAVSLQNPSEMDTSLDVVLDRLNHDGSYRVEFQQAFPGQGISEATVSAALARFEASLVTVDAPFDRYLKGDERAIGVDEKAGYGLFKDLGCSSCHFGPLVGGRALRKMGRRRDYFKERSHPGGVNLGRYRVTRLDLDRHWFKVPSLRLVAVTFPYFHDGSTSSLMDAITVMASYQLGRELSAEQAGHIARFLESLSGKFGGRTLFQRPR